jgi:nucleotide-binding universal stress UspA family protein
VVGFDGGPRGDDAILEALLRNAVGMRYLIHVVHIVEPGETLDRAGRSRLAAQERELREGPARIERRVHFVATLAELPYCPEFIRTHVRFGRPVEALLQMCVDYDAELLVLGTHERRGIDRLMLGSVAEELVRKAHCPVLIARPKDYRGTVRSENPS